MSASFEKRLVWQGIAFTLLFVPRWMGTEVDRFEIHSENYQRLPITETGYRSHFIHESAKSPYGSPEAYIIAWLDHAAESKEWKAYVEKSRQLTLF